MPVEDLGELRALRRTGLQIDLNPLIAVWESCKLGCFIRTALEFKGQTSPDSSWRSYPGDSNPLENRPFN
jgi:hypothetical protein